MSTNTRTEMLQAVRSALGGAGGHDERTARVAWNEIPRAYEHDGLLGYEERLALLEERLRDYDAEVARVQEDRVSWAIQDVLFSRQAPRMLVAPGFPGDWLPSAAGVTQDADFTARELDSFDGVITAATLAIAETGSLVLQSSTGQGRRAISLVPDFHLCVVRADDVVENVPEAIVQLQATASLPTTFISGPSATADIEMTRIKGVHGPRFLYVLLVVEATQSFGAQISTAGE